MPSNIIAINGSPEYNVPDSKMVELIEWLKANGYTLDKDVKSKLRDKYSPQVAYSG